MITISNAIDRIFTGTTYWKSEKQQLARLYALSSEFPVDFHDSILSPLHIQDTSPAEAKKPENLQARPFKEERSQLLNLEVEQIVKDLEIYLKSKEGERVYKIICCVPHMMTVNKLFASKDHEVSDLKSRIREVRLIQRWILAIMGSNNPSFSSDKNFTKLLNSLNDTFNLIDEKLKNEVKLIKQRDLLSGFKGNKYLESVINSLVEYFSSLPNNGSGFFITRLLQDMDKEKSEAQKFLKETNIGQFILTLLYNPEIKTLFSIDRESLIAQSLYDSIIDKNPKVGICPELWQNEKAKTVIVNSLEILNQLANSANIASGLIEYFSGRAGNVMLAMGALKEYVNVYVVEMTCDMLEKLHSSLKIIDKTAESLSLGKFNSLKRAQLKRTYKSCEDAIEEAIENYRALNISVNSASIKELTSNFRNGIESIIRSIITLHNKSLPLLGPEQRAKYKLTTICEESNTALATRQAVTPPTRQTAAPYPGPETSEERVKTITTELREEKVIVMPLVHELRAFIAHNPNILTHKTFIIISRAKAENALSGNNANAIAIRKHCEGILQSYLSGRHTRTTLKRVAIGGAAALVTGAGAGAIGGVAYYAITAVTATMAVGIGAGVGIGVVAIGFSALYLWKFYNISAERLQSEGTWERLWERMGLAWEEMAKTLSFSAEYERNKQLYLKLFAWYTNVLECVEELNVDVIRDYREGYIIQDSHKEFRLKVLEGILAWEPAKDRFLIDELKPESRTQEKILIAGQKLRGMFLYLLKHAALYFPEGAFIPHEGNATLKKTEGNRGEQIGAGITYDLKSGEESAVEAGENFFIGFITGTIEEIKMVPTIMTDVQATTAQNYLTQ